MRTALDMFLGVVAFAGYAAFVLGQLVFTAAVGALFLVLLWALGLDWLWK